MSFLLEPGDLARTPLAAVLLEALNQRASGVLSVAHGGGVSRLFLREGRPVAAQVFTGFRPLGLMLLQAGLIDVDALSKSLQAMSDTGRPQGELLVEMGAVSRADVDRMLAEQQAGYFGLIAALDGGAFTFDAAAVVPAWTSGKALLSPVRTIVDALERPQAGALVASALRPVAQGGVRIASGYAAIEAAFRWSEPERALVSLLDRPIALDAFFASADVAPERARAILAGLLLLGLAVSAGEQPAPSGDTMAGLEVELAALVEERPAPAPPEPAPTPAPLALDPAIAARRSDPAEARARRQRLLQQAMRNMGIGPLAGGRPEGLGPAPTPAPTPAPVERPLAPPPPAASPVPAPGSAEAALRSALLAVAPRARDKDLFARLGLADTASREDVKRAFRAIAQQFHPDRFASPALRDLADTVRDFFSAVNEAYQVLSDDRKRAEYQASRKGGATSAAGEEAARVDFQKGEACLRTRDFARARGFYESALRAHPRAEYRAALAQAWLADPKDRNREKARALLEEAVREAACDRAQYAAGVLAREDGDEARAERFFRAALAANPKHGDASRELRLLEARRAERRGR